MATAGIGTTQGGDPGSGATTVSASSHAMLSDHLVLYEGVLDAVDGRTLEILRRRRVRGWSRRRGWLVRRLLLASDVVGLTLAFALARPFPNLPVGVQVLVLLLSLPAWVVAAKIFGLYDGDDVRTDHSTVDDLVGVFELITTGAWAFVAVPWLLGLPEPAPQGVVIFWLVAIALLVIGRAGVRTGVRHRLMYLQNTIIVGAGDVGQLVARKFLQHRGVRDQPDRLRRRRRHAIAVPASSTWRCSGPSSASRNSSAARRRARRHRILAGPSRAHPLDRAASEIAGRADRHRAADSSSSSARASVCTPSRGCRCSVSRPYGSRARRAWSSARWTSSFRSARSCSSLPSSRSSRS